MTSQFDEFGLENRFWLSRGEWEDAQRARDWPSPFPGDIWYLLLQYPTIALALASTCKIFLYASKYRRLKIYALRGTVVSLFRDIALFGRLSETSFLQCWDNNLPYLGSLHWRGILRTDGTAFTCSESPNWRWYEMRMLWETLFGGLCDSW
jgi:hypothetical protein